MRGRTSWTIVLSLAVAIAANVVALSVYDSGVLRPFPFPEPERLVGIGAGYPRLNRPVGYFEVLSAPEYLDIRDGARTIERVVAFDLGNEPVMVGETPERVFTAYVWADPFQAIGIGAAIAVTVGHSGLGVLVNLGVLILTLYAALVVFMLVVLLPTALITRVPFRKFGRAVKEPALIAFSTTSSEAALPKAMLAMQAIGVPKRVVAFVMPTGYSFNLDGTTLYLAVASVFVAQAATSTDPTRWPPMSFEQQIVMMFTLMVTSKGVAAVPRASLVILAGTLASFGLPLEAVDVLRKIIDGDTSEVVDRALADLLGL